MSGSALPRVVLWATGESTDEARLSQFVPDAAFAVATGTRELESALLAAVQPNVAVATDPETGVLQVVVVPMCTGRDLTTITHAAQSVQWFKRNNPGASVVLAMPPVNDTYAIAALRGWLRKRAAAAAAAGDDGMLSGAASIEGVQDRAAGWAAVVIADAVDPFADAELLRRVRLAQQFSIGVPVEVAFEGDGGWPTVADVRERIVKLNGAGVDMFMVRGDLGMSPGADGLLSDRALQQAVAVAVQEAVHRWQHGDDGIGWGLLADHDTGFAHSHGDDGAHGHTHEHAHGHGHTHGHTYSHGHGHGHTHEHAHEHGHTHGHTHAHDHGTPR